jgi:membrane-bound serine protease (ClpP class)
MKKTFANLLWLLSATISAFSVLFAAQTSDPLGRGEPKAVFVTVSGAIGPATKDYLVRSLEKASNSGATLFIIKMDTPGGLDSSMRDINQAILSSRIPVVTYVAPSGARAASAGTYILYASHIAAMAPATNLGAATPVQIGGGGGLPGSPGRGNGDQNDEPSADKEPAADKKPTTQPPPSNKDALARKAINDAVAYIKGLAELRGRNKDWAEQAVRQAASLSAQEALEQNVIDLIATNMSDLLNQIHGKTVNVLDQEFVLHTEGIIVEHIEPDWRNQLLSIITDPNVAYILMLIGIYGLIFEFSNPGAMFPGIIGAICLLLALFAFQVLPINYAGFALIILGIVLMVGEAFVPSFGALGIGGVIAFVIGSVILMDTDVPGYGVSLPLIASFALVSSALFVIVLVMALKARRQPVVSGPEELVGATAEVLKEFDSDGLVHVHGENWSAHTEVPLQKGQKVRVLKMDGLTLWVEPVVADNHKEKAS